MTLALLITAAASAWADSFSADAYAANATLNGVSVTANQTVTINKGVTVTVNNGLSIQSNATLTVTGGGTLVVNGATGAPGADGWEESDIDPNTWEPVVHVYNPTAGGPGGAAITINGSAQLALSNATVIANGGQGGQGGHGPNGDNIIYAANGADGNGFASFPAIEGAILSYSTNGTDYTEYESGNTTLYRYMKVEPEVTISQDAETKQYEASFKMPQYDVTATYTIKRDMSVDVDGEMADRIRIKKDGNEFQAVDASQMNPVVKDNLETNSPVTLTETTDYTKQLQKQDENDPDTWTDVTALSVGNFRYKITGAGNYSGIAYSNTFKLFLGYELEIAAGKYATFYMDEAVTVDTETSPDGELYTITEVNETATEATLSDAITVAPANTPLLVKNKAAETKTILLIPTTETAATVTFYEGFKGTLEAKTTANNETYGPWNRAEGKKYYGFNGTDFVWIREAGNVAAHRCWIELSTTAASAAPQIRLIFSSTTGIESVDREQSTVDGWYDLNGRRLPGKPTKKGVYIVNGKKMVVK